MGDNQQNNSNQIAGALTLPRSEANAQPLPVQPRQPRDLQGLLRFAMEATKAEDAPNNSEFTPMDEERRKFLEEALASLTVDMAEVIRTALKTLTDEKLMKSIQLGDPVPEQVQAAFDSLFEVVDDMDIANDFYKMGGFAIFPICLGSENETIRALACSVLGDICQNNPFCQAKALECGLLSVLLSLVHAERGEPLAKEIYAISCACREYEPACAQLVSEEGCATLTSLLAAPETAARTKAAFLIRYLCHNYTPAKEIFIGRNLVKTIAAQIKNGRDSTTEHLLSIIVALLEDKNTSVIRQCTEIDVKSVLNEHLKHPDLVDDSFREEKEYCEEILNILENCPKVESVGEPVDRVILPMNNFFYGPTKKRPHT